MLFKRLEAHGIRCSELKHVLHREGKSFLFVKLQN